MAFADPQSFTAEEPFAGSLVRTGSGINIGTFARHDNGTKLSIQHTYAKRTRRVFRADVRKVGADVLQPATNTLYTASIYLVVDAPPVGFTNTELIDIYTALADNLSASSGANLAKFLGGES